MLPGLLTRVAAVEGITLECTDEDVAQVDFAALTDRIDIVVAHRPEDAPDWPGVQVVPLLREPLDVAVPVDHPLAGRSAVWPADLVGQEWISVRVGFPIASLVTEVAGPTPRVVHRVNDFHVTEALVGAGHGISLLPRYTFGASSRTRLIPLEGVRAARRIDALLRRDRAERLVVRRVLHELRTLAATIGPAA